MFYNEIELAALSSVLGLRKENKMKYWLTSLDRKAHQRAMNRLIHRFNKALEEDDLWLGRFMVRQDECPQWKRYEDGSGAELWVRLRFIDRATGRYYVKWETVNVWRGLHANGYEVWHTMNWLITEHWDVWQEDLARERRMDEWREYNKNTRRI